MKKLLAMLLALVMIFGLTACGEKKNDETSAPTEPAAYNPDVRYLDHRISAAAEELGSIITSDSGPYEGYWDDALTFLVEEVDRQNWPQVLNLMNWGANCLNTFYLYDPVVYDGECWRFSGGELTISHLGEWHEIVATYNIQITQPYDSWLYAERPMDSTKDSYLLMYAPAKGYYIIEISDTHHTQLTTLSEPYYRYNYVSGRWLSKEGESEISKIVDSAEYAIGKVLFRQCDWHAETTQETWDEAMTFLVEEFDSKYWHWLFPTFYGAISYASQEGYDDINVININDPASYGDEGNWSVSDGKFTYMEYNYIEWASENIELTKDDDGHTVVSLVDPTEDGIILVLLGDYYYYIVRFTDDAPTSLTNLADHFEDEFSIYVP